MQLRFKIVIVFILSLIVSVVVFLAIFAILIATPFSGGYSEKDMNLAANAITDAIVSLPKISRQNLAPILNKWQKKYPNMTFSFAADSKVLFSTAPKNSDVTPNLLAKIAKFPMAFPNQLATTEPENLNGELPKELGRLGQFIPKNGMPTTRPRQQETLAKPQGSLGLVNQIFISNYNQSEISPKKNHFIIYTYQQRSPAERVLARQIKRSDETAGLLLITVKGQFYTAIELFTDPQKAGVIITIFLIGLGFTIVFTSIFAVVFTRNISRRFNNLCTGIGSFELGNLNVRLTDHASDEIGRITATFNRMTEKISQQFSREQAYQEQRRQLISDVSHDLRTPLTSIIGYTESLENGIYETPGEQRNFAGIIHKKALYMDKLLDELLEFSRMESESFELQLAETNLAELTREILIEYLPLIKEQDISLQVDIPDSPVFAKVDPNRISRVLRNLIDNAIKYGSQGKYLRVAVTSTGTTIGIEVEDHGPGISEAEQVKIFDRFYRIDKGRNSAAGGAGLGLAIAREIVRKHGGQIRVTSEKGKGTILSVELPTTSTQESKPD